VSWMTKRAFGSPQMGQVPSLQRRGANLLSPAREHCQGGTRRQHGSGGNAPPALRLPRRPRLASGPARSEISQRQKGGAPPGIQGEAVGASP